MDLKNFVVASLVALMFVLQGIFCWRSSGGGGHRRSLCILTLLFAGLGFSSYFLVASGFVVFSPEYGVVIAEGRLAWAALVFLSLALSIAACVAVHTCRVKAGWPSRWAWRLSAGTAIAALTVSRIELLDPGLELNAPLHAYDIWWPLLPLWTGLCSIEALAALAKVQSRLIRPLVVSFIATGFSSWAVWRDQQGLQYADPLSAPVWKATLCVALPVFMLAAMQSLRPAWVLQARLTRVAWIVLSVLVGGGGIFASVLWVEDVALPMIARPWFLWVACSIVVGVRAGLACRALLRQNSLLVPDVGKPGRWDDVLAAIALLALAMGLSDPLYFRYASPVLDLLLVLVGWAIFVEVVTVGPIIASFSRPLSHSVAVVRTAARTTISRISTLVGTTAGAAIAGLRWFFAFSSTGVALFRLVLVAGAVVALAEVPYAGKTIVVPFTELGLSPEEAKDFGRMISHRVVNYLGTLVRDLQPEVAIVIPSSGSLIDDKSTGDAFGLVTPGDAVDRPEAVVGGDVEIGGVKIPVGTVTAWIQTPMRWLLGVRVVTGSVQRDGEGYILLANSSDGGIYRVRYAATQNGGTDSAPDGNPPDRTEAADKLASDLAYQLMAALPEMARTGMTQSWEAAGWYAVGLDRWNQFKKAVGDHDTLTLAIDAFRTAVKMDRNFALGHHRLGLALVDDGQPFLAAEEFRLSTQASREFAMGYNALASHVYFNRRGYEGYYASPTNLTGASNGRIDPGQADQRQAHVLWHQVLRLPSGQVSVLDRAAAYYGLCRMRTDGENPTVLASRRWAAEYASSYLAYFHCHRALTLYATLPPAVRQSPEARGAEATAWNTAGVILALSGRDTYKTDDEWHCSEDAIVLEDVKKDGDFAALQLGRSPYTGDALVYYERASALQPEDAVILCNRADAAFVLDDRRFMQELSASSAAHQWLGDALVKLADANQAPEFYKRALREFEEAFRLDPQNVKARNNYSYAVWTWYLKSKLKSMPGPPAELIKDADRHARYAAQLAAEKKSDRSELAMIQSTLGEVLLMQGRWSDAYEVLDEALDRTPTHPAFNEIRWDLAVACRCATSDTTVLTLRQPAANLEARADMLLDRIRSNEQRRERQPFTDARLLEDDTISRLCRANLNAKPDNTIH